MTNIEMSLRSEAHLFLVDSTQISLVLGQAFIIVFLWVFKNPFCYKYISAILIKIFQTEISYVSVAEDNWFSKLPFKPTTEKEQKEKEKRALFT